MMRWLIAVALALAFSSQLEAQTNGGRGDNPPATCMAGDFFTRTGASPGACVCGTTNAWTCITAGGGGVPSGAIIFIDSGTCPAGYAEDSDLSGKTIIGTVAANKDVGTTGGSDTITPAGTNSAPAIAWPAGVPTFAGQASTTIVNHTHLQNTSVVTTGNFTAVTTAVDTSAGGTGGSPTLTALSVATGNPVSGGAANYTPAGTISWPAGVPTQSAATFTGTQFDNRSAWVKLIACKRQ